MYSNTFVVILFLCYGFWNEVLGAPMKAKGLLPQIPTPEALTFMKKYGYIEDNDGESEALYTEDGISDIIKSMQNFGGIPETGRIDNATMKLMKSPRCGVPDILKNKRPKRFLLGSRGWEKKNITYFLANWSPRLGEEKVMKNIQRALDTWGGYGRLNFQRSYNTAADIIVAFGSGYHGDMFPFDGDGGILAHAFFPYEGQDLGGDIHFDNDEKWIDKTDGKDYKGIDFFTVALHELGHSLGLAHTNQPGAVMFPYYTGYEDTPQPQLGYDDILGMYDLYIRRPLKEEDSGTSHTEDTSTEMYPTHSTTDSYSSSTSSYSRSTDGTWYSSPMTAYTTSSPRRSPTTTVSYSGYPSSTQSGTVSYHGDGESVDRHKEHDDKHKIPKLNVPSLPNICDGHVDAVATLREELFVFREQFVWRFRARGQLEKGYPVLLWTMFPKLPKSTKKIDAVYQRPDGLIVIFIGNRFWVYNGQNFVENSPKPLTDYGLPDNVKSIDAVQTWRRNRKTYLYKGDIFWRFNETSKTVDEGYPLTMERWRGIPDDLDAATTWNDGVTYFFKGPLYWAFDNNWVATTDESPMPTAEVWFGCPEEPRKMQRLFP